MRRQNLHLVLLGLIQDMLLIQRYLRSILVVSIPMIKTKQAAFLGAATGNAALLILAWMVWVMTRGRVHLGRKSQSRWQYLRHGPIYSSRAFLFPWGETHLTLLVRLVSLQASIADYDSTLEGIVNSTDTLLASDTVTPLVSASGLCRVSIGSNRHWNRNGRYHRESMGCRCCARARVMSLKRYGKVRLPYVGPSI